MADRNIPEEIKERLPVEQVVGSYVPLKKAGRQFKGLCPFHSEKTPSFTVTPDRGIFKCFGCGKGGDIFDFVMEIEGLTFPEAVRLLADKAGVAVEEWHPPGGKEQSSGPSKTKLFALNKYIAQVWHEVLTKHPKAEPARQYLKDRGLTEESIATFEIGYAPFGATTGTMLTKAGYSRAEAQAAGDPGKFQDRITFPIADLTGKIVGFTGRLLELKDDPRPTANLGPKYWNTPETSLFVKSRTLYALHLAKHAIQQQNLAILAEGQMDVVALHQAGYTHAVASSGTALTPEQLKLLSRFADTIAFAYDGDKAGIEATKRGLELALELELNAFVIAIPNGKDPADCLQKNPELWEQAYEKRLPFMQWVLDQIVGTDNPVLTPESKKRMAKEAIYWLSKLQDPTEQGDWIPTIAARLQTSEANIRELFSRTYPQRTMGASREQEAKPTPTSQNLGELAVAILLTFPETYPAVKVQLPILESIAQTAFLKEVLPRILDDTKPSPIDDYINVTLNDDQRKRLALKTEELLKPYADIDLTPSWAVTELSLILQRIRSDSRSEVKTRIAEEINRAQQLGDKERVRELFQELQNLV